MRFFFFKTCMADRGDGRGPQPTLRALPGQTFDDGTPVDENLNVHAPKKSGESKNGSRLDYPDGTCFCSDTLRLVTSSGGVHSYTVYDEAGTPDPNFHPVSADPNFNYVKQAHRSEPMNVALVKFLSLGDQQVDDVPSPAKKTAKKKASAVPTSPADSNGKARPENPSWIQRYDDQVEQEASLIVMWMRKRLNEMNITSMARRPKVDDEVRNVITRLYRSGENIDSITSTTRFNSVFLAQKMDVDGLMTISKGPLMWYLGVLAEEHAVGLDCSAVERDPDMESEDAVFMVNTAINNTFGKAQNITRNMIADMKEVLKMGWTLPEILNPEVLEKKNDTAALLDDLKKGVIPMPETTSGGTSLVDQLMANKKYACPKDRDGFHVDPVIWKLIIRNIHQHKSTMLTGPTGSGKTELVRMACERMGLQFKIIPMGAITDPTEQLIGKMDLDPSTGGTKFDLADFALAVQRPGVILLDEINRCPKNGYNILFSVLDGTATLTAYGAKSSDQREIHVHPDCVFFATANIGYEYTGTCELDAALSNRFINIELGYMPPNVETAILCSRTGIDKDDAANISFVASRIRESHSAGKLQHSVSTRETLMCAEMVKDGFDIKESIEFAFLPSFEKGSSDKDVNSERGQVRTIIASRFNKTA